MFFSVLVDYWNLVLYDGVMDDQFELIEADEYTKKRSLSFVPTYFVICALPLRATKDKVLTYSRSYNQYSLRLISVRGKGLPGGRLARLLLSLFTTEAVLQKNTSPSQRIILEYRSIKELMKKMGIERCNHQKEVSELLDKFAATLITFDISESRKYEQLQQKLIPEDVSVDRPYINLTAISNVPFFDQFTRLEVSEEKGRRGVAIFMKIVLSQQFVEMAQRNSVPVDYDVYKSINSSLGKDLYVWLVYRNNSNLPKSGLHISRKNLVDQFMSDEGKTGYEPVHYQRIIEEIKEIKKKYYKDLNVHIPLKGDGITLFKSPSVIKSNDIRYVPLMNNYF